MFVKIDSTGNCVLSENFEEGYEEVIFDTNGKEVLQPLFYKNYLQKQITSAKISVLKDFLRNTDWYYARKLETGEEVPSEVVGNRVEAREFIRLNE